MSFTARDLARVIAPTGGSYYAFYLGDPLTSATADWLDENGAFLLSRAAVAFTDLDATFPDSSLYARVDGKNFESCIVTDAAGTVGDGSVAGLRSRTAGGAVLYVWDVEGAAIYWREKDSALEEALGCPLFYNGWLYWPEFSWSDGTPPTLTCDLKRARADLTSLTTHGTSSVAAGDWPGGATSITNDTAFSGNVHVHLGTSQILIEAKIQTNAGDLYYFWLFTLSTGSLVTRYEDPDPGGTGYAELPFIALPVPTYTEAFGPETATAKVKKVDPTDPTNSTVYFPTTSGWSITKSHVSVSSDGLKMGMWKYTSKDFIANTIATPHGSEPEVAFTLPGGYTIDFVAMA